MNFANICNAMKAARGPVGRVSAAAGEIMDAVIGEVCDSCGGCSGAGARGCKGCNGAGGKPNAGSLACPKDQVCDVATPPGCAVTIPRWGEPGTAMPARVPPGSFNGETWDPTLACCDLEEIARIQSDIGEVFTITSADSVADSGLNVPAGYTAYAVIVDDSIGYSHITCIQRIIVQDSASVAVEPLRIALQRELLIETPEGSYALAWDYPKPADPLKVTYTDGRCDCGELCECLAAAARLRLLVIIPTIVDPDPHTVQVHGLRGEFGRCCGPCPPPRQCNRVLVVS